MSGSGGPAVPRRQQLTLLTALCFRSPRFLFPATGLSWFPPSSVCFFTGSSAGSCPAARPEMLMSPSAPSLGHPFFSLSALSLGILPRAHGFIFHPFADDAQVDLPPRFSPRTYSYGSGHHPYVSARVFRRIPAPSISRVELLSPSAVMQNPRVPHHHLVGTRSAKPSSLSSSASCFPSSSLDNQQAL